MMHNPQQPSLHMAIGRPDRRQSFQPPAHLLGPKTPSGECAWRRLRSKGPPMRAPDRTIVILRIIRLIYGARNSSS